MTKPTPHLEKLAATLCNDKLPESDKPRVEMAIKRYRKWVRDLRRVKASENPLETMVGLLDDYKRYVDLELIFDSPNDFLYRQKGQLKLDNSIIEEFLPWLLAPPVCSVLPDCFAVGPTTCYSAMYFDSTIRSQHHGGGLHVRTKAQDFAISRRLFVQSSHSASFEKSETLEANIGYVATEFKTNLDKTMFQEACATARDLRCAVPGARYFLMCEWLDMTPVSTVPTDIAEVLILRRAKRVPSSIRNKFSTVSGRKGARKKHAEYLRAYPFSPDVFQRWIDHIVALLTDEEPFEDDALENGYF